MEDNKEKSEIGFAFAKENYKLVLIGLGIIIFGFILMAGGGSDDPNVFDESIFSFTRITLAPIVVLAGFGFEIYTIMHKPKSEE
jgi:membrane-bound ClpP family serine protease